ncbi:double-strand break repair helicase AddA [Rhodobacteraceae bacterium]|nr:double-strand break repair helicase AddA [Paracoccaceae bacterium]
MTDKASRAQIDAANPNLSTWLSANAGSGKTRVLTNRVARLLLRGTDPRNILCLTYTKAAASEMQNRLFATLGSWAMLEDTALRTALQKLGETPPDDLSKARTLFASAIEAPGGLRIQTIHALCASILRQFPLEGGVSPQFRELDELGQVAIIENVLDDLSETDGKVMAKVSSFYAEESLVSLGRAVSGKGDEFAVGFSKDAIFKAFAILPDLTYDDVLTSVFEDSDLAFLHELCEPLRQSEKVSDHKLAEALAKLPKTPSISVLIKLEGLFLTGETAKSPFSAKIGKIPTKDARGSADLAPSMPRLEALMERVETGRVTRINLMAAQKTLALHRFAKVFLPAYRAAKINQGVLDFDDLIRLTRDLLTGPALSWVLYRLDGQIEHILVDEAQDTSPAQWQIVQALTQAMADDADRARTLFVVGDKKQSIYSFQGADAEGFDLKARAFDDLLAGQLHQRELLHSFRSSPAILKLVDAVSEALTGLGETVVHHAFHDDKPGRVDVLPLIPSPKEDEHPAWNDPVDRPVDNAPSVKLGQSIAQIIRNLLETETIPGKNGDARPILPGDIMVLVQRRSAIFDQVIQACKTDGLPIAGSDRLKIGAELAVRDLLALLSFLDLPEDDLSLAAVLRSPIFGLTEEQLYDIASNRPVKSPLWPELRRRRDAFPDIVATLDGLRKLVDFKRPFELLEHILGALGARERLLARLGPEAEDGIDELLNQAIAFERENVPSLTGFLLKARAENIEIKRDADASGDLIRVMTVHGAKGLERPIVILPDTTGTGRVRSGGLVVDDHGMPMFSLSKTESPDFVQEAKEKIRQADLDERNRLLYVAMTRAENWLIVGGIEPGTGSGSVMNWHQSVSEGMARVSTVESDLEAGAIRFQHGDWPAQTAKRSLDLGAKTSEIVEFLSKPTAVPEQLQTPMAPSKLKGAKVLGGGALDEEAAKRRGRQIHLLLEHLPGEPDPESMARRLLSHGQDRAEPGELPELLNQAMRNLTQHPDLFTSTALAEVDIFAASPSLDAQILGTIDLLIVTPDGVQAVDIKTNAVVPDHPEETPLGLLRQMGAYLEALEQVYLGRPIEVSILWTETGNLMVLPHGIVREALVGATIS